MSAEQELDPAIWRITAVVAMGPFMSQMDATVVNVSFSTIRQQLHASISTAQWIISGYLLALALMLPLNGWLVDRLGAKRVYLGSFCSFTLASVACGLATRMDHLIWARVLQGMAGGLLAPMAQMMIARVAGKQMARVVGYMAMPVLIAPILGPALAGAILKYAGWPWLFYINLPIGLLAVALAAWLLPADEAGTQRRPFDFLGFGLISPGLVCFLYGIEHVSQTAGAALLVLGIALIAAFVWDALGKASAALLDLRLFTNRIFTTGAVTQFLSNGATYAGQMLVPLYLLNGCGFPATKAGWLLAPMGVGMMCIAPLMGFLTDRFGCRAASVGGILVSSLGTLPFLWLIQYGFSPLVMLLCMFARGAGLAAIGIPSMSAAYASVPREKLAIATTTLNIIQRLGGPIATTGMAILLSLTVPQIRDVGPRAFLLAFVALIVFQLAVLSAALRLPLRIHN